MAFFENIGEKFSQVGQSAVQKTRDIADVAKLNGMITDAEKSINYSISLIGKTYFDTYGENPGEQFAPFVNSIKEAQAKIEQYREQIQQIKGIKKCPNCGAEVPATAVFCNSCGGKVPMSAPASGFAAPEGKHCPNCGVAVDADQKFCTSCGSVIS